MAVTQPINHVTYTIDNAATDGGWLNLTSHGTPVRLYAPAEFDGTQITVHVSHDGSTDFTDHPAGADNTISISASKSVELSPSSYAGVQYIKLVAVTSQTGATSLVLACRPV